MKIEFSKHVDFLRDFLESTDVWLMLEPLFAKEAAALLARDGEFAYFYMKQHLLYVKNTYKEFYDLFYGICQQDATPAPVSDSNI